MKELSFKEVIANIKKGEVWESNCTIIKENNNNIEVEWKVVKKRLNYFFSDEVKYTLQRKEVSFQEAFKA